MTLTAALRHHGRRLARSVGYDVHRYAPLADPSTRLVRLLEHLRVTILVDVGANDGSWASEVRRDGFRGAILSFEPHPIMFQNLATRAVHDDRWTALPFAIGTSEGPVDLRMTADTRWSSTLGAAVGATEAAATTAIHRAEMKRLDSVLHPRPEDRVFLKIDVQGAELAALRSAEGILEFVVGAEAEVMLAEYYEGQPALAEVVSEFEACELRLSGVANGYIQESGTETYLDLLFTRSDDS